MSDTTPLRVSKVLESETAEKEIIGRKAKGRGVGLVVGFAGFARVVRLCVF